MNRGVFLSLLALDSYNRGYGQLVAGLPDTGGIGNATIVSQSDINQTSDAVAAEFYAVAYQWGNEKIISYRGTDYYDGVGDVLYGWPLASRSDRHKPDLRFSSTTL